MNEDKFDEFLEMSEEERLELLICKSGVNLSLWQKLWIKHLNKWWTRMMRISDLPAIVLWETIYKGRF
jgi:hypothetical protein